MTKKEAAKNASSYNKAKDPFYLTEKEVKFCYAYLIDRNRTNAAIIAGFSPKTATSQANRLFTNVAIKRKVNELISKDLANIEATAERIKKELTNIAFVNIADAYDSNGALKPFEDMPVELQRAIMAVESEELFDGVGKNREQIGYTKRLKFIDKMKALELLGKHQKMFVDVVETSVNLDQLATLMDEAEKRAGICQKGTAPQLPLLPANRLN